MKERNQVTALEKVMEALEAAGKDNGGTVFRKLCPEDCGRSCLEGVLLCCLVGLNELTERNYRITITRKAEKNPEEPKRVKNNIQTFLESDGCVEYDPAAAAPSQEICRAYQAWCKDNSIAPHSNKSLLTYLQENQRKLGIRYTTHANGPGQRSIRGYQGIRVLDHTDV